MHDVVRGSDTLQRPLFRDAVHLLGELVKANFGYRREHLEPSGHYTHRWINLGTGRKRMEFPSRRQEDGDDGEMFYGA